MTWALEPRDENLPDRAFPAAPRPGLPGGHRALRQPPAASPWETLPRARGPRGGDSTKPAPEAQLP